MTGIAAARRWVALVVLGLGASLLAILGPTAGPASAEGEVTVTWPEVTRFNPDAYNYSFEVSYSGTGKLRLWDTTDRSRHDTHPVVLPGTVQPMFYRDGPRRLVLLECFGSTCERVATSPDLSVHRELMLWSNDGVLGPTDSAAWWVWPAEVPFDVEWSVRRTSDNVVVASGVADQITGGLPPIGDDPDLVEGNSYQYVADVAISGETWGEMSTRTTRSFRWDESPTTDVTLSTGYGDGTYHRRTEGSSIYPAKDGWRDSLWFWVDAYDVDAEDGQSGGVDFEVTDAEGQVVFQQDGGYHETTEAQWTGRDETGELLPEGNYTVVAHYFDEGHNETTRTADVILSHKQRYRRTWKTTVRPTRTVLDKAVGRCARLISPARPSWEGSLGYRTADGCGTTADRFVATVHGIEVPRSHLNQYGGMRVTLVGGAARGERGASIKYASLNRSRGWIARDVFDGDQGAHSGEWIDGKTAILGNLDRDPYVVWTHAVRGDNYDVKNFVIEVKYVVLR